MGETYNFSDDFQEAIIASVVRNPDEFWSFGQIIKPEYFNGAVPTEVVMGLLAYQESYGKYPNFSTLGNYLYAKNERRNPDRAKEIAEYVEKLAHVDTADYAAIRDMTAGFARERSLLNAIKEIYVCQQEGRTHEIDPVRLVEQALNVGKDTREDGINLLDHMWQTINRVTDVKYGIRTGYSLLDNIWKSGWAPDWLIVPLAPPKSYKTTFCLNLACNMIGPSIKSDVIYIACEISEELAMMRTLFRLSGRTQEDLYDNKRKFFKDCQSSYGTNVIGNMWFKGYASKTATISDIKTYVKHLIRDKGVNPKAIFIDYAETVKPSSSKGVSDWRQQSDIYTEARAMAKELKATVIMPDRCNREAVNQEVPSMLGFQGAIEKAGIVDGVIGLCCTPEERRQGTMRYFIVLNRHGLMHSHFRGKVYPDKMLMTIDEDITDQTDLNKVMGTYGKETKSKSKRDKAPSSSDFVAKNPDVTQTNG